MPVLSKLNYALDDAQTRNAPPQDQRLFEHCGTGEDSKQTLNDLKGQHAVAKEALEFQKTQSERDKIQQEREENRAALAKAEAERKAAEKTAQKVADAEALEAATRAERKAEKAKEDAAREAAKAKHRDALAAKDREVVLVAADAKATAQKKRVKDMGDKAVDLTIDDEDAPEAKRPKTDEHAIDLTLDDGAPPPPPPGAAAAAPASSDATPTPPTPPQQPDAGASPAPATTGQVNDPAFVGDEVSVHEVGYQPAPPGHMAAPAWRRSTKRANKSACKAGSGK